MFDKIIINNFLKTPVFTETPTTGAILHCNQEFLALLQLAIERLDLEREYGAAIYNKPLCEIICA